MSKRNNIANSGLALNHRDIAIQAHPSPEEILLPLGILNEGEKLPDIEIGRRLVTGEELMPDVFSPVTGLVKSVESFSIENRTFSAARIAPSEDEEIDSAVQPEKNLEGANPEDVLEKLSLAGLGFISELGDIKTLIVSAVDADPLAVVNQQILREESDNLSVGLKLLNRLTSADKIIIAVPAHLEQIAGRLSEGNGNVELFRIKSQYPAGLPEILVKNISRVTNSGPYGFITTEMLAAAVSSLQYGRPFISKVVTVVDRSEIKNLRVRLGTQIKDIVKGCNIEDDDKVIVGGPMQGYSCLHTGVPVTRQVSSIYIQPAQEVNWYENLQCTNCGRCVQVCPANLDVNLIARYAEFSIFDKCRELETVKCIECGLCAYVCPARRSLVQLLRLAKKEIEIIEREEEE